MIVGDLMLKFQVVQMFKLYRQVHYYINNKKNVLGKCSKFTGFTIKN